MLAVGWMAHAFVPGLPWAAAFALGAIVSPPDAVAATAVLERLSVPRRIVATLEGESLVNDATALVALQFAVAALLTGSFSPTNATIKSCGPRQEESAGDCSSDWRRARCIDTSTIRRFKS